MPPAQSPVTMSSSICRHPRFNRVQSDSDRIASRGCRHSSQDRSIVSGSRPCRPFRCPPRRHGGRSTDDVSLRTHEPFRASVRRTRRRTPRLVRSRERNHSLWEIVSETSSETIPLELVDTSDHLECEIDDSYPVE